MTLHVCQSASPPQNILLMKEYMRVFTNADALASTLAEHATVNHHRREAEILDSNPHLGCVVPFTKLGMAYSVTTSY